jgi:hypothetical protein
MSREPYGVCYCDVEARSCDCVPGELPTDILDRMSAAKYRGDMAEVERLRRAGEARIAAYFADERRESTNMTRQETLKSLAAIGVRADSITGNGTRLDSRNDDYLNARLEAELEMKNERSTRRDEADAGCGCDGARSDGESSNAKAAHDAMVERNTNAWRKPATAGATRADEAPANTATNAHAAMVERNTNAWRKSTTKGGK